MRIANTVIAGASRCGTTALYEWLAAHPEVTVSTPKETRYFMDSNCPLLNPSANFHSHKLSKYPSFFAGPGAQSAKIVLEATPDYLYQQTALAEIPTLTPQVKVLILLRNPAHRALSLYRFARDNQRVISNDVTFERFVTESTKQSAFFDSRPILKAGIENGKYVKYLKAWKNALPPERLLILASEQLWLNPATQMAAISDFLNIDASIWNSYSFPRSNASVRRRFPHLRSALRRSSRFIPTPMKATPLIQAWRKLTSGRKSPTSTMEARVVTELKSYYAPSIVQLEELLGVTLPW